MREFSDLELKNGLENALTGSSGGIRRIVEMKRRAFAPRTSHFMEEVDIRLSDGTLLSILVKHVGRSGMLKEAAGVKPPSLLSPTREAAVYRHALSGAGLGTPRWFGTMARLDKRCLLLERVQGRELFQFDETEVWQSICRWLAKFHRRFQDRAAALARKADLLTYDRRFYMQWAERARKTLLSNSLRAASDKAALSRVCDRYETVAARLASLLPKTLIHGEFYASNILIDTNAEPPRICPIDWEMAAWGPGLIDLAALTAGRWSRTERAGLTEEYRLQAESVGLNLPQDFELSLNCCRLHLAMMWLGWSVNWTPPEEHRHDWLREALELGNELA